MVSEEGTSESLSVSEYMLASKYIQYRIHVCFDHVLFLTSIWYQHCVQLFFFSSSTEPLQLIILYTDMSPLLFCSPFFGSQISSQNGVNNSVNIYIYINLYLCIFFPLLSSNLSHLFLCPPFIFHTCSFPLKCVVLTAFHFALKAKQTRTLQSLAQCLIMYISENHSSVNDSSRKIRTRVRC